MKKQGNHFYRGTRVSDIRHANVLDAFTDSIVPNNGTDTTPNGANIAGVPTDEPNTLGNGSGDEPYIPRHMTDEPAKGGNCIPQPDGSHIAPNGAVIRNPWSEQPEIEPGHEYTPEKEDLNLLIM